MTEKAPDDGIFKRMLLGLVLGFVGGFACAIIVAYLRGLDFSSDPVATNQWLWPRVLRYAILDAAPLGAIYMSLASISLLRAEKLVPATFAILTVTIIFALVGEGFVAPLSPFWLDASIGFWIACIAIRAQRERRRDQSGWEAYFK
jgi:hypothetical protein